MLLAYYLLYIILVTIMDHKKHRRFCCISDVLMGFKFASKCLLLLLLLLADVLLYNITARA